MGAHGRDQSRQCLATRQKAQVFVKGQRPDAQPELRAARPHRRAKPRIAPQCAKAAQPRQIARFQRQPAPDKFLHPHWHAEKAGQHGLQRLGGPGHRRKKARKPQARQIGQRVAPPERRAAQTCQRGQSPFDPASGATVEIGGGLASGPGAVQQRHEAVREHVHERHQRRVAFRDQPVAGIFGQMRGQGAMRAEIAKEPVDQRARPGTGRREAADGSRGESQLRLLSQPHAILARTPRAAQRRRIGKPRLDQAQGEEDVMGLRVVDQPLKQRQIVRPRPVAGRHRAISPLCWDCRTVSVKLLSETCRRKNRSSTAPRT